MKPPLVRSSQTIYSGFFDLRTELLERGDGKTQSYTSLFLPWDAAVVLAEDADGRLVLNREYRPPAKNFLLGCPGGRLEEGEDPISGGRRELFEETGYWAENLSVIGACYPIPSLCNQKLFLLHAKNAYLKGKPTPDAFEFIETVLKTEEELRRDIQAGALVDGILCMALWHKASIANNH